MSSSGLGLAGSNECVKESSCPIKGQESGLVWTLSVKKNVDGHSLCLLPVCSTGFPQGIGILELSIHWLTHKHVQHGYSPQLNTNPLPQLITHTGVHNLWTIFYLNLHIHSKLDSVAGTRINIWKYIFVSRDMFLRASMWYTGRPWSVIFSAKQCEILYSWKVSTNVGNWLLKLLMTSGTKNIRLPNNSVTG